MRICECLRAQDIRGMSSLRRPEWNGAQGPVDHGFARTEAERRRLNLRALAGLEKNKDDTFVSSLFFQSARRDSNPRPRPWQGRAPPTEPLAHIL